MDVAVVVVVVRYTVMNPHYLAQVTMTELPGRDELPTSRGSNIPDEGPKQVSSRVVAVVVHAPLNSTQTTTVRARAVQIEFIQL